MSTQIKARTKSSRRPNGEGTVYTRKDGIVEGRYYDSKGIRQSLYGKKGTTEAQMWGRIHTITEEVRQGEHISPDQLTVEAWLTNWDVNYCRPTYHDSTYISYMGHVYGHIIPQLGETRLQDLEVDILQGFFNERRLNGNSRRPEEPLSYSSLHNIYNTFKLALDQAVDSRKIKYNPILGVRLAAIEQMEVEVFTLEEQEALCRAALMVPELHAFGIIFALATGVRIGELLALKWSDLNEKDRTVFIKRSVARITIKDPERQKMLGKKTEVRVGPTKTKKSRRRIALFDQLWDDLMAYKQKQNLLKLEYGDEYQDEGWIFCNPLGGIIEPRTYQDLYGRVVEIAISLLSSFTYRNFHVTRHTFATRALENGMDIQVLSAILGHAQTSTTLNRYGHALPSHVSASMDKMGPVYASTRGEVGRIGMEREEVEAEQQGATCQIIYFGSLRQPGDANAR